MEQTGGTVLDLDDATTIGYFGHHLSGEALRWWLDLKATGTVKTRRVLEDAFLESQGPKEVERLAAWKTIARLRPHHYTDWENFQQAFMSQYRVARPLADKEEMIPLFMAILPEEVNEELMKKGDISDFTELSKTAQHYYELNNPKYASTNPVNAYGVPSTAPHPNKPTPIPPIAAVNAGAYPDLTRLGLSSEAFARKCGCEIRETKFDLTAYGGANVEVVGETTLFLSHPQSTLPALPWDVLVTRGSDIELLLGLDFLSNKKDVMFDLKNNRMIYSHFLVFPLSSTISLQQQPVSIVQRSSIPPRRVKVEIVCSVSGFESGAEIYIEKKWQQENGKFQLAVPDQVLKVEGGGVVKMRVSNFREEECSATLGAGQEIAKAISVENSREQAVAALWADAWHAGRQSELEKKYEETNGQWKRMKDEIPGNRYARRAAWRSLQALCAIKSSSSSPSSQSSNKRTPAEMEREWAERKRERVTGGPEGRSLPQVSKRAKIDHLSSEQQKRLTEVIDSFSDAWSQHRFDLGRLQVNGKEIVHEVHTTGPPIRWYHDRVAYSQREMLREELKQMEEAGLIEPSSSAWATPVVLVPKPDGTICFCLDFRKLNAAMQKNGFPMPRIDEVVYLVEGASVFTVLDVSSGFWQIGIREQDKEKTAFVTPFGLYQFKVMAQGLINAPATFQQAMQLVLSGLPRELALVYIDDLIVFSKDFDSYLEDLRTLLDRVQKCGLKLKVEKAQFALSEVKYLGFLLSADGIRPDPAKLEALRNMEPPRDRAEVRSFLGLVGWYRQFIERFSEIAFPLSTLLKTAEGEEKKQILFRWTEEAQAAFDTLRNRLCEAPCLAHPRVLEPFIVKADSSDEAVGGVLKRKIDEIERVIEFCSKTLTTMERKWGISEKEGLGVMHCLRKCRHYLLGKRNTLQTDHKALLA
uniref:Reverse transcriptase domain-containing protein n=1 Tax=Chromera velia CCMP2878 TaxID=1169474 RepID=A0A0G4HXQ9_9ALVE|eukprot:Cvel_9317.t1-p1 / transcript=Cvel_9317.t1 / gene=Cvel_9317 / organism=Chromera_velia_CCMP2878 / gene_product=Retrovirus-related Pol polyprotein from transposon, putative / transcript_product=Retrovirus-related Pol polyprotein from transposon, putative / location=Cvel_scaffold534:24314-27603(-) / protein_length=923 / sequence_SO=supercontig / SO=protein_coding / is_pseudo=false